MALTPGTRLGPYEVTAQIGVGGMGEVYRATDTNLKRAVAIKVLPASLAGDAERLARFQREAEVLASLNHPNIAQIHGLEESGGITALVMELVEGPTLADRIAQGAIPVDEALPIAKQIAEALEAAHEQGIIHRDLKPANVKVRSDGTVKVLDFGLAKALEPAGSSPGLSQSPTITSPAMTQQGVILGTAAYMSPEQAKGRTVDKRSDVWAFGAVLYEMLTWRRAFDAEDVSETLAEKLTREVAVKVLPVRCIRVLIRAAKMEIPARQPRFVLPSGQRRRGQGTRTQNLAQTMRSRFVAACVSSCVALAAPAWGQPALTGADRTVPIEASGLLQLEDGTADEALPPGERYRVAPLRVDQGPQLDGILDEEVWLSGAVIDDFVQQEPSEGNPATERTVVRLLYDARSLYIGVEAFDSDPQGVIATEMRRDSPRLFDEDNFQIILDTFDDSRSGYMFVTNPLGGKLEQQVAEEGEGGFRRNSANINVNWDGVWHVAARRTPEGWIAEIAIPMVTLRFPKAQRQVWGVNFMRNIRRKNEQVFWAPIPKAYSLTRVSLAGTLTGLDSVNRGMDLRMTPYVLVGGRQDRLASNLDGSGFNDVGLDMKYGVVSGLNLDVTLNTDFAQVEVDEQQVNLTRFPLFFPEKRDFFLENAGLFSVRTQGFGQLADLFFTRRIGLSAVGQPIPIIGGARLTGKVSRHNIAAMNLQTRETFSQPGENLFVARYSRDVFARSKVGGLIINKEALDDSRYNRTFAADTTLALHRNFTINSFIAKTQTPGISTGDMAGHIRGSWLSPSWRISGEYTDIQDHFNAELGFVPRTGIRTTKLHGEWDPRPGKWGIRQLDPMLNIEYTTDQHNRLVSRRIHHMVGTYFENGASLTFIYNDHFEHLDEPFPIRRDVTIPVGTYRFGEGSVSYRSDPSRRFYQQLRYSPQTFFNGTRTDWSATLGLRATARIAAETQFRRSDVDLPSGAFVADLGSLRFDLALSPQTTLRTLSQYNSTTDSLSTSVRFNWIYSPGSDLYIAYDELRMDVPGVPWLQNRQLAIKMTYLLSR